MNPMTTPTPRRITAEEKITFPCWFWSSHAYAWFYRETFPTAAPSDEYTHWHPFSSTPPTVVPGEDEHQKNMDAIAASVEASLRATPPDLTKIAEGAVCDDIYLFAQRWFRGSGAGMVGSFRENASPIITRHLQPLTAELARLKEELGRVQNAKIDACIAWTEAQDQLTALRADLERVTRERDELQATVTSCEEEVAKVYWHITGGMFSKMNTRAQVVIDEYEAGWHRARQELDEARASFKNFHRNVCEAADYHHDEKDWERDLASCAERVRRTRSQLTALQAAHAEAKRDGERIDEGLTHIYDECEGYEDGAPDAGPKARLANAILPTIRSLLAIVRSARTQTKAEESRADGGERV